VADSTQVLVAGAGPAGLMLANWLTRLGVDCVVVDRKEGPTQESRALIVQARSLEIYDQLGMGEAVDAAGRHVTDWTLWQGLEEAAHIEVGAWGAGVTPHPYIFSLEQSRNEELMLEHLNAQGGEVLWRTSLEGWEADDDGVVATLAAADGSQRELRARYLCAADGASSPVRESLDVSFEGSTNPHRFYVADVMATGSLGAGDFNMKLATGTLAIVVPMAEEDRWRVIGVVPENVVDDDEPSFEDVRPILRDSFGIEVSEVRWFATYKVNHRVAGAFREGPAFLVGDAGHIHSPVGGQGMNTGLCDAHNLAWKLAMVTSGRCEDRLLDTYDAERRPFAERLIKSTDRLFGLATADNPLLAALRGRVVPEVLGHVAKTPSVGPKFFGLISQTEVEYDSVLGEGERLPWSGDNYEPLRSLRPQLHFYGTAPEAAQQWLRSRDGLIELCELPYTEQAEEAGLERDAGYLVRPDGYVSLKMDPFDAEEAEAMLRVGWGLRSSE
jgi:2-polyprenyl-6-methoxyphenol hydroxylase-like FAD-dependent oxidoreductase